MVESQKMIYAPPSREKSKQTMRSPMIDKAANAAQMQHIPFAGSVSAFGGGGANADEYLMGASIYSGGGGF